MFADFKLSALKMRVSEQIHYMENLVFQVSVSDFHSVINTV